MPRRTLRPGFLSRRKMAALRHTRAPKHLQECADCRNALSRERQYLERLRCASVPEASQDLAARLIQHTERLANQPVQPPATQLAPQRVWRGFRIAGAAVGTLAVSAVALSVCAYVVAGDDADQQASAGISDIGALAGAWTGTPAEARVGPAFRAGSTVSLSAAQLETLRDEGWACPELSAMGFQVVSAQATIHNGHPAVEIRLESKGHYATIVEEHLAPDHGAVGPSTSPQLSVTQGTPWRAVYTMPAAVISYASDLPAESADDAVPEIVRAGDSMGSVSSSEVSETLYQRLLRGLRTLLRPAGL